MNNGILVFIEHKSGVLNRTSLEAIAAGQALSKGTGQPITAILFGSGVGALAQEIATYDIAGVVCVENGNLAEYTPDAYAEAMEKAVRTYTPHYVVMAHTYLVRDYAPKVSARFGKGVVADCIRMSVENGAPRLTRRIFLGKIDADIDFVNEAPCFITFQSGAFRPDAAAKGGGASVETVNWDIAAPRMTPEPAFQEAKQAVDLTKAEVIVAVGRGIKSQENIAIAEQLAGALGGDIAASRPICDAEWLPIDRQIGSSGQTVAPKLYVALGISGAIQHLVGMKNAGTIVAINKDPEAPIFDIADYGIVGDLFEAVPALTEEIKKIKGV
jgi:electron transfer flavoprotein alpha subunit